MIIQKEGGGGEKRGDIHKRLGRRNMYSVIRTLRKDRAQGKKEQEGEFGRKLDNESGKSLRVGRRLQLQTGTKGGEKNGALNIKEEGTFTAGAILDLEREKKRRRR